MERRRSDPQNQPQSHPMLWGDFKISETRSSNIQPFPSCMTGVNVFASWRDKCLHAVITSS